MLCQAAGPAARTERAPKSGPGKASYPNRSSYEGSIEHVYSPPYLATLGPIGNIYSDITLRNLLGRKIRFGHRKPSRESIAAICSADILTFQGESICAHPEPPWWSNKSDFQKMQKRPFLQTLRPCGVLPCRFVFLRENTIFFEAFTEAGGRLVPPIGTPAGVHICSIWGNRDQYV